MKKQYYLKKCTLWRCISICQNNNTFCESVNNTTQFICIELVNPQIQQNQGNQAMPDYTDLDNISNIGQYSKSTCNFHIVSGFNKRGMAGTITMSMILTDKTFSKQNDCTVVFNSSKSILKPQLLVNGFKATKKLLTDS